MSHQMMEKEIFLGPRRPCMPFEIGKREEEKLLLSWEREKCVTIWQGKVCKVECYGQEAEREC